MLDPTTHVMMPDAPARNPTPRLTVVNTHPSTFSTANDNNHNEMGLHACARHTSHHCCKPWEGFIAYSLFLSCSCVISYAVF